MIYTEGQQTALSKLIKFILSDHSIFVLSGSAGTGKTTIAQEIPGMVTQGRIVGTAPTHKAVGVLAKRMPDIECMTIHSFLGLRPMKKGDKQILARKNNYDPSQWYDVRVVVVDESSMNDSELMKWIEQDIETWGRKYILLGDQYQIPPVSELYSPCFSLDIPDECKAELTEIMRHAGPIIIAATAVRDAIISGREPDLKPGLLEDGTGVRLLKNDPWHGALNNCVQKDVFRQDPDFCRVIAWKNDTVMRHIQTVRGMMGEDTNLPFCVGDNLVANEAWIQGDDVIFNTGAEFTVLAMEEQTHPAYSKLKGWQVWLEGIEDVPVYVLDLLSCRDAMKTQLSKLAEEAKQPCGSWVPFYTLSEHYADLRPLYALTAHKSQGSGFQNSFIDLKDIYANRIKSEADRCLYVAITRAIKNVLIKI